VFRAPDPRTGTRRQPSGNWGASTHGSGSVATVAGGILALLALSIGTYAVALPAAAVLVATVAFLLGGFILLALLFVKFTHIGAPAGGRSQSHPFGADRPAALSLLERDS
jgi:hypothetical protein